MKDICYSLRSASDGQKVLGGTLRADTLDEGAEWLTRETDVMVTPSGRVSFAKDGKPVCAYLSVDPAETEKGQLALKEYARIKSAADRLRVKRDEEQLEALRAVVDAVGLDKAIELLTIESERKT